MLAVGTLLDGPQQMNSLSPGLAIGRTPIAGTWRLLAPLAALHAGMFVYDLQHPARFLNADRALERVRVVEGFGEALRSGEPLAYLAGHGIVGDWLPQALAYLAGGQYFVILLQVVLALASVLWVRDIALRVGLQERLAGAAALLYALLPHTLVFPHQLASEAVFVPLIVLAFRLGARGGLALGAATLVRPVTLLWPFAYAALMRPGKSAARARFVALALAPLFLWMCFIFLATGDFSMGRSGHDLGNNLYYRLQRLGGDLPAAQRPAQRPAGETKAGIGEYLAFVAAHPLVTLKYAARDFVVLAFKSGVERVVLDYLDLYPQARSGLQLADGGWRSRFDRDGAKALLELLRGQPALVLGAGLGALVFTAFMLLAAYGGLGWLRSRQLGGERLALVLFVLYIFATTQAVDAAQSRLRAPAEFALCVLALAGWAALKRRGGHGG